MKKRNKLWMNWTILIIQKNKPNTNFNNFIEMKRIILVLSLVLGINMIYAQTSKEIKFDQYAKKIEKSDAEIKDPKKISRMVLGSLEQNL
jgi:hypothetical protein